MSNTKWEQKREALAKAAVRAAWPGAIDPWPQAVPQGCWLRVADFILAREAEREGLLVEALRDAGVRLQYLGDVVSAPRVWDAARERLACDVFRAMYPNAGWTVEGMRGHALVAPVVDLILARQREREGPLVEALNYFRPYSEKAGEAIRAWQALDALPPQRTLAEVAADVVAQEAMTGPFAVVVPKALLDELAAALRREKEAKR